MKQATTRVCTRCNTPVWEEHDKELKEYPYYCPDCDENMFTFETHIAEIDFKDNKIWLTKTDLDCLIEGEEVTINNEIDIEVR